MYQGWRRTLAGFLRRVRFPSAPQAYKWGRMYQGRRL